MGNGSLVSDILGAGILSHRVYDGGPEVGKEEGSFNGGADESR